jgi:hypothetical protein
MEVFESYRTAESMSTSIAEGIELVNLRRQRDDRRRPLRRTGTADSASEEMPYDKNRIAKRYEKVAQDLQSAFLSLDSLRDLGSLASDPETQRAKAREINNRLNSALGRIQFQANEDFSFLESAASDRMGTLGQSLYSVSP